MDSSQGTNIYIYFSKFQIDLHSFLKPSLEHMKVKDLKAEEVLKVSTKDKWGDTAAVRDITLNGH